MTEDTRTDEARRLSEARETRGFKKARAAADFFGWNYSTYSQHERGERGLTKAVAEKYASAYRVSAAWLLTGQGAKTIPTAEIVGLAGAGPEGSVLFAEGQSNFGEVPIPPGASDTAKAIEVRGDSMHGLASDGWIIFYDDPVAPAPEMMGEPCVVWLEDGRVLVKMPYPGTERELFNLLSVNAPPMRDVPVRAMALVTAILPRASARKFSRQNSDQHILEAKVG